MIHPFNGEMLLVARRSRELTQSQLAKSTGISGKNLSKYENGLMSPSDDAASSLAVALDYPVGFFCRKPTLIGVMGGAVFHRKQTSLSTRKLYGVHALAEIRRLEVTKMMQVLDVYPPVLQEYPVDYFEDDPEKIARSVRTAMNLPPGPIFNLTETLERNGCVVVAHEFDSRQISGFCQRDARYPPCFLHMNVEMPPDRWRWTLAHELGHLVMHFDESTESESRKTRKMIERQADLFAAEFLTPAHAIGHSLNGLTFQKLGGLKREWKVSMQSLITRAYHLGTISDGQRRAMYMRLSKAGYRTREPATLDPPVEKPSLMSQLAQRHLDELGYSRTELREFISIGETDFRKYYLANDILESLGINEIVNK